jgi:predicted nuclease of predicted toxin-antitoxin system
MSMAIEERVESLEALLGHFLTSTGAALNRLERVHEEAQLQSKTLNQRIDEFIKESQSRIEASDRRIEEFAKESQSMIKASDKKVDEFVKESQSRIEASDRRIEEFAKESQRMIIASDKKVDEFAKESQSRIKASDRKTDEFIQESQSRIKASDRKMEQFIEEMRQDRIDLNKKWGELANKMGTIVEDIVAPNIPGIAKTYFGVETLDFFGIRIQKAHPEKKGRKKEFDVIAVSKEYLFFNETKASPRQHYLEKFASEYSQVFDYFPEYRDKKLIPIFSSLSLPPDVVKYLTHHGIYAMAMTGETMDLLNYDSVSKQD